MSTMQTANVLKTPPVADQNADQQEVKPLTLAQKVAIAKAKKDTPIPGSLVNDMLKEYVKPLIDAKPNQTDKAIRAMLGSAVADVRKAYGQAGTTSKQAVAVGHATESLDDRWIAAVAKRLAEVTDTLRLTCRPGHTTKGGMSGSGLVSVVLGLKANKASTDAIAAANL